MDKKWTSRKVWIAMFWQSVFTVLLFIGKLPPTTYEALTLVTLGGYLAANVGQRFAERGKGDKSGG